MQNLQEKGKCAIPTEVSTCHCNFLNNQCSSPYKACPLEQSMVIPLQGVASRNLVLLERVHDFAYRRPLCCHLLPALLHQAQEPCRGACFQSLHHRRPLSPHDDFHHDGGRCLILPR